MGFFPNIFKKPSITKIATAVVTGGLSVVAPKLTAPIAQAVGTLYDPKLIPAAIGFATGNPALALSSFGPTNQTSGGLPMSLNLGGILGSIGNIFGGSDLPAFQTIGQLSNLAGQFIPQPVSYPTGGQAQPVMAMVPAIRSMGTALTREVFDAGAKVLSRLGISYPATTSGFSGVLKRALGSIASLARRTPAGTLPSLLVGLGLTSLEAYLLTAWHAQRKRGRRMNPANSKALHRAARRIKSFHKLCTHTDVLRGSRSRRASPGRCGTCRKSPCKC